MPTPGKPENGDGNGHVDHRVSKLEQDHAVTRVELATLTTNVKALSDAVKDGFSEVGDTLKAVTAKLDGQATTTASVGKFSTSQITGGVTFVVGICAVAVAMMLYVMRQEIGTERLQREASDAIASIQRRATWEILRAKNPDIPEYPFGDMP